MVSPAGSLSSFEVLPTFEVPDCEYELPSSLTPPHAKRDVDLKKYHPEPLDLTDYIEHIESYPDSGGGFSNVWKCKLGSFDRNGTKMSPQDVAVKAFRVTSRKQEDIDRLIKKLRQEVFIWQALECTHILPFYGTTDGFEIVPSLVCPWMKNGSLDKYLNQMWHANEQLLPNMHRLFLLLFQIVSGLQYLHVRNIIHGDLMAYNVLIDEDGNAVLADFGLSLLLAEHETSFFASHSPGAVRWAAPEILSLDSENPNESVSKPNKASDIYSFGCIMMQVLSGRRPYFEMTSETLVIVAKSRGTPPKRPTQPAINDVYWCYVERCWSSCVKTRPLVNDVLDYIKAEYDRQKLASQASCSYQ
ncbi:kinase-like domain-containing protein [Suillus ampliporus]|nr:kinase-like domain-containing protein [Suillus ampliporus]